MFRNTLEKMIDVRDLKRAEREDGEAGFTLIELLVVVVIIGILIAIAIPLYLNYTKGAKDKGAESDVRAAVSAVQQCYTDNNNTLPASGTQTAAGDALTFTCGTATESSPASDGTTIAYVLSGTNYTITAHTSGADKQFQFDSATGKVTSSATTG